MSESLPIVSADGHVGPRLVEDLRAFCPPELLSAFDAYVNDDNRSKGRYVERDEAADSDPNSPWRNQYVAGHHDPEARRRDLEREGIVSEVIFHGSQNNQPVPWQTSMLGAPDDPELAAAGIRIYNDWLGALCSTDPDRHVGLAHLPMWDIDAAVTELRRAHEVGLRGVNFPAPRPWVTTYNDPAWEPFWALAEELGMPLTTHSGAGDPNVFRGAELVALMSIESGGWFSRRAAHLLIFAGVFERHPGLQLVLTEQPGTWWATTAHELDSVHAAHTAGNPVLRRQVPKRPSEYLHSNVWIGASFLSRLEAQDALEHGYVDRLLWGADYPHMEGTFQAGDTAFTPLSLRFALHGFSEPDVRAIVGGTAAEVYGLDLARLTQLAGGIGAPTYAELTGPIEGVLDTAPVGASPFAFRTSGPWS